jgi:hypothetical protein
MYMYMPLFLSLSTFDSDRRGDGVAELSSTGAPLFDFLTHDAIYMVRL